MPKSLAFEVDSVYDDFKESEHPRGKPGNAGQFAPAPGGGGSGGPKKTEKTEGHGKITGTGHGAVKQPDFKGSLARETEGDSTQPVQSLNELYDRAKKAEKPFKNLMEETAKKFNSEVMYTPPEYAEPGTILKSSSSSKRKLAKELGNDPKLLRDVIRATIASDTVEDTRKAAAQFIGEQGDNILRVKDRYVNALAGGYRDILINYRTPEGLVAEVQFNSKNMVKAKNETAHALYETARELVNPTKAELEHLEQQMAQIYEHAYIADGDGKGWKHHVEHEQAHDAEGETKPLRRYRLRQEDGPEFEAALVEGDGKIDVYTNRNGAWAPDDALSFADLIMPEQRLADWDVERIEASPIKMGQTIEGRATDWAAVDTDDEYYIEYYTNEKLGPNRDKTPEGFLVCKEVPAARVGEMVYAPKEVPDELGVGRDGTIRVTRAASSVFDPQSMASLNGKPVTDDHPPVDVDPKNWKHYTRGVVVNPRRGEGDLSDFLVVDVIIWDENTIQDIEAGKREVSCGYNPEYLQLLDRETRQPIPGRGEQVKIRYNHLALVAAGRCGPMCAIGDKKTVDKAPAVLWSPDRALRLHRVLKRLGA